MFSALLQRLVPASSGMRRAPNKYWENIGILSLLAYAFFWLIKPDVSEIAESFLLLTFVWSFWHTAAPAVRRDPLIYLFIAWVIFQLGVHLWARQAFPDLADEQFTVARHYTKVFLIFVVAWWLGGSEKSVLTVFLAIVLGFFIGSNLGPESFIGDLGRWLPLQRVDFGFRNAQHTAVYATFALLTLSCFWRRISGYFPTKWRMFAYILLALGVAFSLFGVFSTQTRATWLGLVVSGGLVLFGWLFFQLLRYRSGWGNLIRHIARPRLWITVMIATLSVAGLMSRFDELSMLKNRVNAERDVIQTLLHGDFDNIPLTNIGVRIVTWRKALEWIHERPITGWGPKSRKALYLTSDLPEEISRVGIGHSHNSYIEIAVAYGLIGVSTFAFIITLVGLRAWQAWRRGDIPNDLMLFGTLFFIYWLVANSFESYIIYNTGMYLNAIIGGSLYTFHLAQLQRAHVERPAKESHS